MLAVVSGMTFCAGCASVVGMMLVRNERRRRELEARVCLGATGGRIFLLVLAEALLLTLLGSLAGLLVAAWLVQYAGPRDAGGFSMFMPWDQIAISLSMQERSSAAPRGKPAVWFPSCSAGFRRTIRTFPSWKRRRSGIGSTF